MDATVEGIGGLKWSVERKLVTDAVLPTTIHTYLMQGRTVVAEIEDARHLQLLVTAPQLWDAANEMVKAFRDAGRPGALEKAAADLGLMVAKAVGKDDWGRVLQKEERR